MLRHNRKARVLKKPYTKLLYKALIKTAQGVHTLGCFVLRSL